MSQRNNTAQIEKRTKKWPSFWGQKTVPISDPTLVLGQCISVLLWTPLVLQILHLYVSVYICIVPARAYAQAHVPPRRRLCQRGRACARSSGRTPAAPTHATCLLVILTSPRHARARTERTWIWCDRHWFLVRPKLIFLKKRGPIFGVRNWPRIWAEKWPCFNNYVVNNIWSVTSSPFFGPDFGPISGPKNWVIFFKKKLRMAYQTLPTQYSKIAPDARAKAVIAAPPNVTEQPRNAWHIPHSNPYPTHCTSTRSLANAHASSLARSRASARWHARKTERARKRTRTATTRVRFHSVDQLGVHYLSTRVGSKIGAI